MKIRLLILLGICLPLVLATGARGEDKPPQAAPTLATPLTLHAALTRALEANPALGRAHSRVTVAQSQVDLAFSSILPKVSLTGALTRNSLEAGFGSGADRRVILSRNDWNYKVNLTQPIYAGNRERRALEQSRLAVTDAEDGSRNVEDELLLGVVANFLSVAQGDALVEVEKKNIALAEQRHTQAENLYEAGETTKVDVLRAEADTKAAQRRLAEARRQRDQSESRLRENLAVDDPLQVVSPGRIFPSLPQESALLLEAEHTRPEVTLAVRAVENAKLEVRKQRGAYLPTLFANGAYTSQKSPFPAASYGSFSLNLSVPIWQSGETGAKIAVAQEQVHQAELQLQEVRQGVREDVRRALVDLSAAVASLALAKEQLTASEAEYSQASDLYSAQEVTALDLAGAETSLADARRAVATSQLDRDLAEARVWAATGQLKKNVLEESAK